MPKIYRLFNSFLTLISQLAHDLSFMKPVSGLASIYLYEIETAYQVKHNDLAAYFTSQGTELN